MSDTEQTSTTTPDVDAAKHRHWWCLHCERAWVHEENVGCHDAGFKGKNPWNECPYEDCEAGSFDFWPWVRILQTNARNDYPLEPTPGVFYPMYPKKHRSSHSPLKVFEDTGVRPNLG